MEKEIYSHSKLWLFENCPEAYKIKYIDKKFPELPKSIEAFLGGMVHKSLEWLYREVKEEKEVNMDDLMKNFANNWISNFSHDLRINWGKSEDYFNKGIKFLIDYYQKNKPFNDNTIEIEKKILFNLDEGAEYKIRGYIDRIVLNENGEYEVHDYKTNDFMKTQEEVDADRQLAFYHLGINELFGQQAKIKLIWHFLAHNKTIVSRRSQEQLEQLKKETLELIKKIENTIEWPACGKRYCDWCTYKRTNRIENY
ncbi:MAG: PD-(D/E)XK nuclease family protein [Nanoarchaeota archaeon]|nr:PD-(D/E)XK nuclease family protein [Nanoarchaeota archaeon]